MGGPYDHIAANLVQHRTRTFTPRAVASLWSSMLETTHTAAVRSQIQLCIQTGDQLFYRPDRDISRAAESVLNWNRHVLARARLHHFSANLVAHALDCEADFPAWTPTWHDLPTRYGLVVLERPMMIASGPISAFSWGPATDWPGKLALFRKAELTDHGKAVGGVLDPMLKHAWLITAWTPAVEPERAVGTGPVVNDNDFFVPVWHPDTAMSDDELALLHREDGLNSPPRAFKIAFDLARQASISTVRSEPIPRGLRKRLARDAAGPDLPQEVLVHNLRPKLAAAFRERATGDNLLIERAESRYRIRCWPVKPVVDRHTGELRRIGYTAYRDPSLLDESLPEPVEVWRGTDPVTGR
jgi:hypothetical protein